MPDLCIAGDAEPDCAVPELARGGALGGGSTLEEPGTSVPLSFKGTFSDAPMPVRLDGTINAERPAGVDVADSGGRAERDPGSFSSHSS